MPQTPQIAEFQEKFEENPRRYFATLANEYRKAGEQDQAISICRVYLERLPGSVAGHVVMGQALMETGETDQAAEFFHKVLVLDPENLVALHKLGEIAKERGDPVGARDYLKRVVAADPQDQEAERLLEIVTLEAHKSDTTEADDLAEALVGSESNHRLEIAEPVEPESAEDSLVVPDLLDEVESLEEREREPELEPEPQPSDEPPPRESIPARTGEYSFLRNTAEWNHERTETPARPTEESESDEYAGVEPAGPFITETVAELYLQQGFTGEALVVYRQLARLKPNDQRIRDRIDDLENRLSNEHDARQAALESEVELRPSHPVSPEPQSPWDIPRPERPWTAPAAQESDDWFASPAVPAPRTRQTVSEFFAVLGRARPEESRFPERQRVTADDIRAAADVAAGFGAFGTEQIVSGPKPIAAPPQGNADPKEDVRRFRAWLDGLSDS